MSGFEVCRYIFHVFWKYCLDSTLGVDSVPTAVECIHVGLVAQQKSDGGTGDASPNTPDGELAPVPVWKPNLNFCPKPNSHEAFSTRKHIEQQTMGSATYPDCSSVVFGQVDSYIEEWRAGYESKCAH